jgi:eukaryotic-like serine/threonine-protein kinase
MESERKTPLQWDPEAGASLAGQTLGGRYQVERRVGTGGMAHVYHARDTETGDEVAIKVLLPQLASDLVHVARLRREASIAMRLDHPNVCRIMAVGETPAGHLYLVMPYLEGEPLVAYEDRVGPLSVAGGVLLLMQICKGLGHAHDLHVLHRDLKPENIMLVADSTLPEGIRAVVMDFGIAKVLQDDPEIQRLTRSGVVMGTPEFLSPEQVLGNDLDGRSDLYGVGVLAFEMFTGKLPFQGNSPQEITLARLRTEPFRLRWIRPELPEALENVISRALARKPEDRYQSMEELRTALAAVTP